MNRPIVAWMMQTLQRVALSSDYYSNLPSINVVSDLRLIMDDMHKPLPTELF
jgi:hypothetical protein